MNFSWDYCGGTETIIRKMIFGTPEDIKNLLNEYGKEKIKEIFLENLHRFGPKDRNFYKIILEVDDEILERKSKESFRNSFFSRYFP